jgi:predicted secreted protein
VLPTALTSILLTGCQVDDDPAAPVTSAPAAPTSGATMDPEDSPDGNATETGDGTGTAEDGGTDAPVLGAGAIITEADTGSLLRLRTGEDAVLRLSPPFLDAQLRVDDPGVLEIVPVQHFADPGYTEWELRASAPGRASLTAEATDGSVLVVLVEVSGP